MRGIIKVTVALYLEHDVTEDEAQEIVDSMDYEFTHPSINRTEIVEMDEEDEEDEEVYPYRNC